ncbi:MAG: hypothetical protein ACN6NS_13930 [Acinetobacter johnsonii]
MKNKNIWFFVILFCVFAYSFFWYTTLNAFPYLPEFNQLYRLMLCIFMEVIVLLLWFKLEKQRERVIISRVQLLFATNEDNIYELKKMWFKKCVSANLNSYLEIAENIDKVLTLKEKYKSIFASDANSFGRLIFTSDSKNRLLAMFMGIVAALIALTISTGVNIYSIFIFFENYSLSKFIAHVFVFSVFLMLFILIIKGLIIAFVELISTFGDQLDKDRATSKRRSRIFINQLLYFYDLPKPKIRITNEGKVH